jgi:hypothetical protein
MFQDKLTKEIAAAAAQIKTEPTKNVVNGNSVEGAVVSIMANEELKGNQHKIDANKNGKVDAHDFKLLRNKKKVEEGVKGAGVGAALGSVAGGPVGAAIGGALGHVAGEVLSSAKNKTKAIGRIIKGPSMADSKLKREDVEQIDEVGDTSAGRKMISSYVNKAIDDKSKDRSKGLRKATSRLYKDNYYGKKNEEVEQIDELMGKGKLPAIAAYHKEKGAEAKNKMETIRSGNTKLPVPKSTSAKILSKDAEAKYHSTQAKRADALMKKEEVEQIGEQSTYKLGRAAAETKDYPIHHNGEHVGRLEFHTSAGKLHHRVSSIAGVPHEKFIGHPDREKMTNAHVAKHEAEARKHFAKKIKEDVEQLDEIGDTAKGQYLLSKTKDRAKDREYSATSAGKPSQVRKQRSVASGANARMTDNTRIYGASSGAPSLKSRIGSTVKKAASAVKKVFTREELESMQQMDEAFPTVADAKKRMAAGQSSFEKKKISTGTVYSRKYKAEPDDADDMPKKKAKTMKEMLDIYRQHGAESLVENLMIEEPTNDEYKKETEIAQAKSEGKIRNDKQIAKAASQGVKMEEVEFEMYDADEINGVQIDTIDERSMTDAEMDKREEIVKSMKKGIQGFKDRYGKDAKSVMYATATKNAMKD